MPFDQDAPAFLRRGITFAVTQRVPKVKGFGWSA